MSGTGTATIDFGAGSNEAQVSVSVPTILGTSPVESWIMGDDESTDHTASDHRYFPVFSSLTCGTPSAGVGFTIYARSIHKLFCLPTTLITTFNELTACITGKSIKAIATVNYRWQLVAECAVFYAAAICAKKAQEQAR